MYSSNISIQNSDSLEATSNKQNGTISFPSIDHMNTNYVLLKYLRALMILNQRH